MEYDNFDIDNLLNKLKLEYNKKQNKVNELINQNVGDFINKQLFVDIINDIVTLYKIHDKVYDLAKIEIIFPKIDDFVSDVIKLLTVETHDTEDWINYWLWDGDFGKIAKVYINKNEIDISTSDKLYDFLYKNYKEGSMS